ncbi:MAG: glutamine-hydrolyzing carbamoyl-phosphate synthase small subunit [Edaphocola sp.]
MSQQSNTRPAHLLLEDGTLFTGRSFGKIGTTGGELCFTTGMTGYQEIFTDPSYTGQMLIMSTAYVGNYGVNGVDVESGKVTINGLICKNITARYSRMLATGSLEDYLLQHEKVGIQDVDTRALVQHVRTKGAMNCIISSENADVAELREALKKIPSMKGLEISSAITTKEPYAVGDEHAAIRIAVLDFGIKSHILKNFEQRGAYLKVFPAKTGLAELKAFNPNGIFISNGPGDPAAMGYAVETVKEIIAAGIPLFGICLGNQLLALANGVGTFKMHHGHRGLNHPVKNLVKGTCEITTQNHGFGIDPESARANPELEITHVNLNDNSIEGIRMKSKPAFSVQYHPESTPGPYDSRYLFDQFIDLIKQHDGL